MEQRKKKRMTAVQLPTREMSPKGNVQLIGTRPHYVAEIENMVIFEQGEPKKAQEFCFKWAVCDLEVVSNPKDHPC